MLVMSIVDMIEHKVSVGGLLVGTVTVILSFIPSLYPKGTVPELTSRLYGLIPGVSMILGSRITDGKIGIGDGILCAVLGLATGVGTVCSVLMLALLMVIAYSIVLLARGRLSRNKQIAFIPFVFMGFLLTWIGM